MPIPFLLSTCHFWHLNSANAKELVKPTRPEIFWIADNHILVKNQKTSSKARISLTPIHISSSMGGEFFFRFNSVCGGCQRYFFVRKDIENFHGSKILCPSPVHFGYVLCLMSYVSFWKFYCSYFKFFLVPARCSK